MKDNGIVERKPVVGLVTLLVIFASLCLTILAVLSLSTAKYEMTLARKNADAATAYYKADSWCAGVSDELYSVWMSGGDLNAAAAKHGGKCEKTAEGYTISYVCAVDDARLLAVTIDAGGSFSVVSWKTVPRTEWTADDSIHVWTEQDEQEIEQAQK